jgi:hypothetical protein
MSSVAREPDLRLWRLEMVLAHLLNAAGHIVHYLPDDLRHAMPL